MASNRPKRACVRHAVLFLSPERTIRSDYVVPDHPSIYNHPLTDKSAYKKFSLINHNIYTKYVPQPQHWSKKKSIDFQCTCGGHCTEACLNKADKIECDYRQCTPGLCSNMELTFPLSPRPSLYVKNCGKKGYGLFAGENIKKGTFVIEYVGEVINYEKLVKRWEKKEPHTYAMALTPKRELIVDASKKGNEARFINHSCEPNCQEEMWMVNGERRSKIVCIKDIKRGQEITFDYKLYTADGFEPQRCYCGCSSCTGFMDRRFVLKGDKAVKCEELRSTVSKIAKNVTVEVY